MKPNNGNSTDMNSFNRFGELVKKNIRLPHIVAMEEYLRWIEQWRCLNASSFIDLNHFK
jgi:hypothetical protein